MALSASTFISDTVKYIRNNLSSNITDPIESSRTGRERFVVTSYPQREVQYPIISVTIDNVSQVRRLGFQSEGIWFEIFLEVRVWARNMKEKDELTDSVINHIRTNQFGGANASTDFELHDLNISSVVPIIEPGDGGIKSSVISISFKAVIDN